MCCACPGWVRGVTQLDRVLYVVCAGPSTEAHLHSKPHGELVHKVYPVKILTYDVNTLRPLSELSELGENIHVEGMRDPRDIVACPRDRQLYVAEWDSIWRVSADNHSKYVKWLITDTFHINSLSLRSRRLLVTSRESSSFRQYNTTDGELLRVVECPEYVKDVWYAVETTRSTFVVGHRGTSENEQQNAVSEMFSVCHIMHRTYAPRKT